MKIGLIDVDGHNFPNLALMKISAWHKSKCDEVEFFNGFYEYDKVYMSKVFDFSPDFETCIRAKEIIRGGIGYGLENDVKLPHEIEHITPDYSLYNIENTAYGFLSRGCPRKCKFCNVSDHQGNKSVKVADLQEFWNGQKNIVLLDPNITACESKTEIFESLIQSNAWIDFTQGLDIRLLTKQDCEQLNNMKIKMLHFAWDNYEFKTYENLKKFRPLLKFDERRLRVYVLVNFNTTHEQDLKRIYKLMELKYDPYVMIFDKKNAAKQTKQLARWVNNKYIFRSCSNFEDYKPKLG